MPVLAKNTKKFKNTIENGAFRFTKFSKKLKYFREQLKADAKVYENIL